MLKNLTPMWHLNFVLLRFMEILFKPLLDCSVYHLTLKMAFLVAITSVQRVIKLYIFVAGFLYTSFHRDKVVLRLHPNVILEVVSELHLNRLIKPTSLLPKAKLNTGRHSLDISIALLCYHDRPKVFQLSPYLFVVISSLVEGQAPLLYRISKWIMQYFSLVISCVVSFTL